MPVAPRRFDHQRARRHADLAAVDREFDVWACGHVERRLVRRGQHIGRLVATLTRQMLFEFVRQFLDDGDGRHGRRVAQRAERRPSMFFASSPTSVDVFRRARRPSWKRSSILRSQAVPSRQGMHQPQLSCA